VHRETTIKQHLRFTDIVRFASTALFQQKTRSLLTTLGVLFGTFVLVISLSLRLGTEQALLGMFRRHNELRMIRVYPGSAPRAPAIPEEQLRVEGTMDSAKRERLRQALTRQWHMKNGQLGRVPLTRERFEQLTGMNHVECVVPVHYAAGRARLNQKFEDVRAVALPADTPLGPWIVAGRLLTSGDARAALVNEFLLYRLGIRDDAEVQRVLGQKLCLEYPSHPRTAGSPLAIANGSAGTPPQDIVSEDLTIVGVFRTQTSEEPRSTAGWLTEQTELFVPIQAGQDLFFRLPDVRGFGLSEATVMVDSERNVQGVLQEIRALGLNGFAALEHVERDRFIFALMLSVMTCVAAVAILVAAFGITNTMLMSVLERQREIGIMKSVGARERDIQSIFLVEGAAIGAVGSTLGLLLGFAVSFPADAWMRAMIEGQTPLPVTDPLFIFPPWLALAIPPIVVLVTILAALLPARRAVKLDPVAALRHE
jgi:ABC-type lipoprotein release transport system permease subunit